MRARTEPTDHSWVADPDSAPDAEPPPADGKLRACVLP